VAELAVALLPFAPPHATALVTRISAIVQGAHAWHPPISPLHSGPATKPSVAPPMVPGDEAVSDGMIGARLSPIEVAPTLPALGRTLSQRPARVSGAGLRVGGVVALVLVAGLLASWRLRSPPATSPAPLASEGPQVAGPVSHPEVAVMGDAAPAVALQALPAAVVSLVPEPSAASAEPLVARPAAKVHSDVASPALPARSPHAPVTPSASPPPVQPPPPRRPDSKDGNALFGLEPK
jgi:hypothetical protein